MGIFNRNCLETKVISLIQLRIDSLKTTFLNLIFSGRPKKSHHCVSKTVAVENVALK